MNPLVFVLIMWVAAAAFATILMSIVRPRLMALRDFGRRERERLWECMDRVCERKSMLKLKGHLVENEQRAFVQLRGKASLESLERGFREYMQAGQLLVALDVDTSVLEAELELIVARHGRFFYYAFLRSTASAARQISELARQSQAGVVKAACTTGTCNRQ